MQTISQEKSEISQILAQISAEYQAAQRGVSGVASGISRHDFISARMENMGRLHRELQEIVGESAIGLIVDTLGQLHS